MQHQQNNKPTHKKKLVIKTNKDQQLSAEQLIFQQIVLIDH